MKAVARTVSAALLAWVVVAALAAAPAAAKQYRYIGPHPIPGRKGAWCYIQAPHVHDYPPAHVDVEYRNDDGWNYFVGDPVAYGYRGPKYAYDGPHPIPVDVTVGVGVTDPKQIEWCYIRGPHYHYYPPARAKLYVLKGGAYWYVSDFPHRFEVQMPRYVRINAIYKPLHYTRPVVTVGPPPGYKNVLVVSAPSPSVEVEAPPVRVEPGPGRPHVGGHLRIDVGVPVPSVEVHVGGGVHIGGGVLLAPGPPHGHPHRHWHRRPPHWHLGPPHPHHGHHGHHHH